MKKAIENWLTELSLAVEKYIGNVRVNGVYKVINQPYMIQTINYFNGENNKEERFIVLDDVISMYSDNVDETYHLQLKKALDNNEKDIDVFKIHLTFKTRELKDEINKLEKAGYKVDLYQKTDNTQCLVAIKGEKIKYELEQPYIELTIE
ncbi:hypothetical protein [Staphylococcus pettenkoferi]|uniref:hypothetical protein n=1 Tax=Staphylococcus pettenkoferi TaxID=170573 RepID=UPI002553EDA2|nr:hypothetical protein [Staphylococcus pettenkoferi]MDK7284324.1 hypothetical protein [Staphylococcus pettenkoferi]